MKNRNSRCTIWGVFLTVLTTSLITTVSASQEFSDDDMKQGGKSAGQQRHDKAEGYCELTDVLYSMPELRIPITQIGLTEQQVNDLNALNFEDVKKALKVDNFLCPNTGERLTVLCVEEVKENNTWVVKCTTESFFQDFDRVFAEEEVPLLSAGYVHSDGHVSGPPSVEDEGDSAEDPFDKEEYLGDELD